MNVIPWMALLVACLAQLAAPAWLIARQERTLREGACYRFHTAPVDPYDAFRGRYVQLLVLPRQAPSRDAAPLRRGRTVCVALGRDAEGFATLKDAGRRPPGEGDYVRARVQGWATGGTVSVRLPFERYYLPEDEAPLAERAYREHSRADQRSAEVLVRVRGGEAVIEDVLIEGKPLRAWLAEQRTARETKR